MYKKILLLFLLYTTFTSHAHFDLFSEPALLSKEEFFQNQ